MHSIVPEILDQIATSWTTKDRRYKVQAMELRGKNNLYVLYEQKRGKLPFFLSWLLFDYNTKAVVTVGMHEYINPTVIARSNKYLQKVKVQMSNAGVSAYYRLQS